MVNRIWQHHFGAGIVRTPSNFGRMGERPSNPELLDYLASRFIESGWSIKALHREIMLSATYALSADQSAKNMRIDPENRLLWRANIQRLDAEALRDSLLFVSGELDSKAGGPPVRLNDENNKQAHRLWIRQPQQAGRDAVAVRLPEPEHHQREAERDRKSGCSSCSSSTAVLSRSGHRLWRVVWARIRSGTRPSRIDQRLPDPVRPRAGRAMSCNWERSS